MRAIQRITIAVFIIMVASFAVSRYLSHLISDDTVPVISSDSDVVYVSVTASDNELMAGVSVWDDAEGDLTDRLMVEHISHFLSKGECKITYAVSDSKDHVSKYERRLIYTDYESPKIYLSANMQFSAGSNIPILSFIDAYDVLDGDISGKVKVVSTNHSSTLMGLYTVTVQVSNSKGDVSYLTFPLEVISSAALVPRINLSQYTVYINVGDKFDPKAYIRSAYETDRKIDMDTNNVVIQSDVDCNTAGTYIVTYSINDNMNREGVSRLVVVVTES